MTPPLEQITQVVDLDTVLAFWAKKYRPKKGHKIHRVDSYVDPHKGKAVFVLLTSKAEK